MHSLTILVNKIALAKLVAKRIILVTINMATFFELEELILQEYKHANMKSRQTASSHDTIGKYIHH